MIWIGLPAYNEAHKIKHLLIDIHRTLSREKKEYAIVVYDDGSSDGTPREARSIGDKGVNIRLIEGRENKGLGYALSFLIDYCARESSLLDTVIIMDADATHNPEHIHRMLGFIKDGFDVVIASRYTPYSRAIGVRLYRQLLSKAANLMLKILFPIKGASDYSCAYRAYTARILKSAKALYGDKLVEEHGFACMAELLIKLRRLGIMACEVPLILRYDRKAGATKMNVIGNILRTFVLIARSIFLPGIPQGTLKELKEKYGI
jgi:dolichol-phosphate mannosyltransferase